MFKKARFKLTAWYLLIIMSVSITFSLVIARTVSNEVDRFERAQRFRIESRLRGNDFFMSASPRMGPGPLQIIIANPELLEETKRRVYVMLGMINVGILAVSGLLGYMLAGRTLQPIKDMMDEQNRFISDASHELRTPLTSLKSAFEVYLRNSKSTLPEARSLMKESVSEVNNLTSLSDSLLQLAQYEKPNGHTKLEKIQLNRVINEAVHKITPQAKQREISIEHAETPHAVRGNGYGLVDLFVILLDNAVKYSPKGGRVQILTGKTDGTVFISVKDDGIGIQEKEINRLFERFYRADSARSKSKADGYGLGLSIAKKIVQLHKGSIAVTSNPGKGSVFTVRLPLFSINSG